MKSLPREKEQRCQQFLGDVTAARIDAQDQVEAAKWYRKAAEQNDADAQYNLAICYERGDGVAEDWVEAYKWLLLAARQGHEAPKEHMTLLESKLLTSEQIVQGQKRAREFKPR